MSQDIGDFVTASCELLGFGEPTHREPAFARTRNELLARLVDRGFRSIALETDRVAALAVDDFVREGVGALDAVMAEGFSHRFGEHAANRELVAWLREHNENRPARERVAFHGFDTPVEMTSAPSPRRYLQHARDYLGPDPGVPDVADLAGADERWSRAEAVMDPAASIGGTPGAHALRVVADDMLVALHSRAPRLIAATSRAEWSRARTHLTAGLGLLRYHGQSARRVDEADRLSRMLATRDALMAGNLLDIREAEARRGATLVFAHNRHLQRSPSRWLWGELDLRWSGTGAVVGSLLGERYAFVAGSLGRSAALGLAEPAADTYEGALQRRGPAWALTRATAIAPARTRADTTPEQGYFPLDRETLDGTDAVLHIGDGAPGAA